MNNYHTPVLLSEIVKLLKIEKDKKIIDATIGGGGHTKVFLEKGAVVLGIDQDRDAIEFVKKHLEEKYKGKLIIVKGNFKDMKTIVDNNNFTGPDAILFDLGLSSHQIDTPSRGFSFLHEGVLDMRMNKDASFSALEVVNNYSKDELIHVISRFGEEHFTLPIVVEIIKARKKEPIKTTKQLSDIINGVYAKHGRVKYHNPATKTFQAIRIEVNNELNAFKEGLMEAIDILPQKGRIGVISYHSLEDRITKLSLSNSRLHNVTKKPIVPTDVEISSNPRSRSAKLRVSEKL